MRHYATAALVLILPLVAFAQEAKNLLKPTNKTDSWRFEQHDAGKGAIKVADDAIEFKVDATTGSEWHVQAYQIDLDLKDGAEYTVKFQAKSGDNRGVTLVAMIDKEDWHEIGLHEDISLSRDYKTFEYKFRANNIAEKKNRIGFMLGNEKGTVVVKEMTLTEKK